MAIIFCQHYIKCIDISVITNNQETLPNIFLHLLYCNLAYECILHVGNYTRFGIMIDERFVLKIHCHLSCHSTSALFIHGGVADIICLY